MVVLAVAIEMVVLNGRVMPLVDDWRQRVECCGGGGLGFEKCLYGR